MTISIVAFVVCVVGLILYLLAKTNAELREIGRIMFFAGLLVVLFLIGGRAVHIP